MCLTSSQVAKCSPPPSFKLLDVVSFVASFAVSNHWTAFKSEEQSRNCSGPSYRSFIRHSPHQARHVQGQLQWEKCLMTTDMYICGEQGITPTRYSGWTSSSGYKYGIRSDLKPPYNVKILLGSMPLVHPYLHKHHHRCPPNLKYTCILPPLKRV